MADTTVTAQTVIDNSIARAKDPYKTQWTDAQMLIFLNKAYDYTQKILIQAKSELVITSVSIDLSATREFSLATYLPDFWGMVEHGVYFDDTPLTPVTVEDAIRYGTITTNTAATGYYVTGTNLGLLETPTDEAVGLFPSLTCRYFKKNAPLALGSAMPYKNLLNEPMSSFMDHLAVLKTTAPTAELTAIYNALESSALTLALKRVPL